MRLQRKYALPCGLALLILATTTPRLPAEAMLQYFNTSWAEITRKMPELAEAGYSSLWLPPPTKASGGLSVGYDLWDPFDLGGKDQRSTVRTRYGTEAELLELVRTAHRFGIRVYFDNIMNHRAFDIPGFNENTPIDIYPGVFPEDFHLRVTQEGFFRKWDNTRDWNSTWQVQNLGLADLIDFAQEPGPTNLNFGPNEGDTFPKLNVVRDLERPEQYAYDKDGNYVGFGGLLPLAETLLNDAGNPSPSEAEIRARAQQYIQDNQGAYTEYVEDYLNRAARWLMDRTKADGLRLDAVKHIRADFFGATFGADKDSSDYGYLGQVQRQFNLTRGFSDWDNHRDTVFNTEAPRDDAMVFGEHLGEPPGYGPYFDSGMRLVDNPLRTEFNNRLGSPFNGLNGFDNPGAGGFAPALTVMHAQSHDSDFAARRELQHAMYFTRAGLGLLYTDGNYQAETLGESGGAFPRHSNTSFLGQWDDPRVPNLLYIHDQFARGEQRGIWSGSDIVAYRRADFRQGATNEAAATTMVIILNDNYASSVSVADQGGGSAYFGFLPGDYLYQYARGPFGSSQVGFYKYGSELATEQIPPGQYFVFSFKNPDPSELWNHFGGRPITLYENGAEVGTINVERRDGPNGDADFHGDTLPDTGRPLISNPDNSDYTYTATLPRVTNGTAVNFVARVDGSAENILFKLDGGVDLNDINHAGGDPRDNPPAIANDVFLGYEQPNFVDRIHPELFAAVDTGLRNQTGSAGAETYTTTGVLNNGAGTRTVDGDTAAFIYHDPSAVVDGESFNQWDGSRLWAKVNAVGAGYKMFVYYTTDDTYFPEGAGGEGFGNTQVVEMGYQADQSSPGTYDWWASATMPGDFVPGVSRYKIGVFKTGAPSWWPGSPAAVNRKTKMLTTFETGSRNLTTTTVRPHNDYGVSQVGLDEGFHVIRARAFLGRNDAASIYNTFTQTFYYDAQRPQGEISFPSSNGETVGGTNYGAVVRTDSSVTEVWYHISDGDPTNDDSETGSLNGNGEGFEPFSDTNQNGTRDVNEAYEDLNNNGNWDATLSTSWVKATEVTPNLFIDPSDPDYRKEWRFNYVNIPPTGNATIQVRLREVSSAGYSDFGDDDVTGHFTTLTRTVNTAGPNERVFIAFPPSDGQVVGDDYIMKTYFSKSLADGLSEQELIDRFLIRIGSTETGDAGIIQDRSEYSIEYNATSEYHALAFDLPNLYNDVDDFLHQITVIHDRPVGQSDFEATRLVRALPVSTPRVLIVNPPELGSDGRPFIIELPDLASPAPEDREFTIQVATNLNATDVSLDFINLNGSSIGTPTTSEQGNSKLWDFAWTNIAEGTYRFTATVTSPGGTAQASRNTTVVFRETVPADGLDTDDDDDGLLDGDENTPVVLPNQSPDGGITPPAKPNSEQWTNGEVHIYYAYGRSNPTSPDSDGDGLPDGLEVGWRGSNNPPTDPATDTDGDGFPNFIADLDPPFYNTLDNFGRVPGVNSAAEGGDRARQLEGSVTDPSNPDTDGDGLRDGIEDTNRNGWVDGDGDSLPTTFDPFLERNWPNGLIDPGETWTETDPNNPDTDRDGASDGFGEDTNLDGSIEGDTNNNRVYDAGEAWTETDPLNPDTDGDGLPDGWEIDNGLNPLDNGTDDFATADPDDGNVDDGAAGDPDGDGFDNAQELSNGTRPNQDDTLPPPPASSIIIGPGSVVTVGNTTNGNEFTDWTIDDLLVLDEYDGNGFNNQGTDIYKAFDGFDLSRDLVAFYVRDGGGDDTLYFRTDLHDLAPLAEDGNLDIYVVIDTGNPAVGESTLPDQIDTRTTMRWEAVVAVYRGNNGAVYVDTDPANNTTTIGQDLSAYGVVRRDQNAASGFKLAYFNSELDAVEFSISRQALLDAGWNGNVDTLNFQVYTTRDGTQNDGTGAGDIGGRSDIRDTIYDDYLASDYWRDQGRIGGDGSVLESWFSRSGANERGKQAKIALVAHGNQAILPGSDIQDLINNDAGAGYHRLIDAHDAFDQAVNLHITGTLASAIEWAAADPSLNKPWRDGPTFNDRIAQLISDGHASLLGTTFSDHIIPYTPDAFTHDSIDLAERVLLDIYGHSPSTRVFWPAERVLDDGAIQSILALGYTHTVVDQMRHIFKWFGRNEALGEAGYRINRVNGLDIFPLHDFASTFRFQNQDNGLNFPLRELLSRRARSGTQDQVLILVSDWGDFGSGSNADAYVRNVRWLANRPWINVTTLDEIAADQVDLSQPADGLGDTWGVVNRGTGQTLANTAKDFVDHATQENYDNWYFGSAQEEGLEPVIFDIRPGTPLSDKFGTIGTDGISNTAWNEVQSIFDPYSSQGILGRATLHAGMFVTAFHNQSNTNLSKFSTGAYIYPDTDYNTLAGFVRRAHSSLRHAALYKRVDDWAAAPPATTTATTEDVDLDGENEYLLANDQIFAIFEASGGRLVAGFARNNLTGHVYQVIGTQPAYPDFDTEEEGTSNVNAGAVGAHRTSGFKDWFANGSGGGTSSYVNALYTVSASGTNGWTFTAPGGHIVKTISLDDQSASLDALYHLSGNVNKLYVRHGLSPDLRSLMVRGQQDLTYREISAENRVSLTTGTLEPVAAAVTYTPATAALVSTAVDDDPGTTEWDTINMRNQAFTQQVEVENQDGQTTFGISLALKTGTTDSDSDGMPDWWEEANSINISDDGSIDINNGPDGDIDGDTISNEDEYITGLDPNTPDSQNFPRPSITRVPAVDENDADTFTLTFPVLAGRSYRIWYADSPNGTFEPAGPAFSIATDNPTYQWTDDGSATGTPPSQVSRRFYQLEITRP